MKNNVKKILLAFVMVTTLVTLGACKKKEVSTDEPITLVYWGLWEPEAVMEELIAEYQQQHSNVTIEYTRRPFSSGQYKAALLERLPDEDARKAPDIMRIHNTWLPEFADELAPLPATVMSEAEYTQTFYDTALKDFKGTDGSIYAIPLEIDTLGLFYNKELFQNAGLTLPPADWDSFIEYAKKLTVKDGDTITTSGAALGSSSNVLHSAEILSLLMLQSDVQMVSDDKTKATFDTSRGETVVEYYTDFINRYGVWNESLPNSLDMFVSGKLAMMIAPSWRFFDIVDANPQFEFDTAKVPQIAIGSEVNFSTYWAEAVSKDATNTNAAWEFVKFLSEKENMQKLYDKQSEIREFGEPYSRKDLRDEIKSAPYVGPFVQMAPTATSWYMGNDEATQAALDSLITKVLNGNNTEESLTESANKVTLELKKLQ